MRLLWIAWGYLRDVLHDEARGFDGVPPQRAAVRALSAAFRRAVRWDWIDHSPIPDVELPSQPPPQPQPPSPAEAAQILGEAWKHPDLGPMVLAGHGHRSPAEASCVPCDGDAWTSHSAC